MNMFCGCTQTYIDMDEDMDMGMNPYIYVQRRYIDDGNAQIEVAGRY